MNLFIFQIIIFVISVLVNAVGYVVAFKTKRKDLLLISLYLTISFIFQSYQFYLTNHKINNIYLFHLYPLIEFVFLISSLVLWHPSKRIIYIISGVIIGSFIIGNSIIISINEFPVVALVVTYLSLVLMFFYFLSHDLDQITMKEPTHFSSVVSVAFIFYFVSVLSSLSSIYLNELSSVHYFHITTQILFYLVLIYAFILEWYRFNKQKNIPLLLLPKNLQESST